MHTLSTIELLNQRLITLVGALLFPLFPLFRLINSYFLRYRISEEYDEKELDFVDAISEPEEDEKMMVFTLKLPKYEELIPNMEENGENEDEKELFSTSKSLNKENDDEKEMVFTFKFPSYEEFISNMKENGENISQIEDNLAKKYDTSSSIQMNDSISISSNVNQSTKESKEIGSVDDEEDFFGVYLSYIEKKKELEDDHISEINVDIENHDLEVGLNEDDTQKNVQDEVTNGGFSSEGICYSEKDSLFTSSDSDSTSFEQVRSVMSFLIDSYSEGFLSDDDFGKEPEPCYENPMYVDGKNIDETLDLGEENWESEEFEDEEDNDSMEEHDELNSGFLTEKDCDQNSEKHKGNGNKDDHDISKDSSEDNKMESLWEHQDLIEQLKMELKKVRASGLPTIFEESESPKIMDDLKPWKIEEKFHHEDFLGELHKVYQSYYGRMRKFDILTYQKMYTIGFLHLKDPFQSTSSEKSSGPTFKSLISQNSWLLKNKSLDITSDPMMKFMKELESDFEVVYVGQMCLSWEFLHWQYLKALDLSESDPHGIRRYDEVADEFQQFQVLIQRFLEDERFQGPRMQYFIKSRCVLRTLLHVPVIREDGSRDKRRARNLGSSDNIITSDVLVEILEESIRIFWRFIQADKDCSSATHKGKKRRYIELHNPEDHELLMEVKSGLQKKNKKLKEVLRGRSCILRRFKKGWEEEEDADPALYFFSQVDMKLVSRALNMSKITTEQLDWCRNKLNGINFVGRKMHVENCFLLFPYYCIAKKKYRKRLKPGGNLIYQTTNKRPSAPKCPIPHLRPAEYTRSRLPRSQRTVNRPYGGVLSGGAVRERVIRAFLVEEQKIVKKVLKIQKKEKIAAKN
ncbi:hypothetical protein LIER_21186 [Lithospermum erythrorhizon]|uniref:60S ribosomal protein L34 n=1 Tax=Lithospermum erythrorhizon TaxID=34254 RepID=A0AAV3QSD6_LITER